MKNANALDETNLSPVSDLRNAARKTPEKIVIISGDRTLSYVQAWTLVQSIAQNLILRGLKSGDVVAVSTLDPIEHLMGTLGAMAAGGIATPIASEKKNSVEHLLKLCRPKFVIEEDI